MSYQTAITVKQAIQGIQKRKYVLPSIQREFVWQPEQIEQLFDSLMRGYPIGTFLFWNVEKDRVKDFQFYDFMKDFHERDSTHNVKADLSNDEDITAILDGQQRLTSLYIALRGTYAKKLPYYRRESSHAFPRKKLYLNLLRRSDEPDVEYDFQFLSQADTNTSDGYFWYEVGNVLDYENITEVMQYLIENSITDTSQFPKEQGAFALNTLTTLFNVIHQRGTISFFREEGEELDKVLQIFIRINSGGTKLSYSDLLLSVATAQWQEKDAREEIHKFVDEINRIGDGFGFDKDFVLKSCLVLGDFPDIKFKVDNFKKENMLRIESLWEPISNSIRAAVRLISSFGFYRDTLTSSNAVIPIAYYIFHDKAGDSFLTSSNRANDRRTIREWLLRVLLKKTFGGSPDALYPVLRGLIKDNGSTFPLSQIQERYKGTPKSIVFSEDDIDSLLNTEYSNPLAYSVLSLLYARIDHSFRFHVDHIHPKNLFTDHKLRKEQISEEEDIAQYQSRVNLLPNLQLLEETANLEKNGRKLENWLLDRYPDSHDRDIYMQAHMFPRGVSLEFGSFLQFFDARKEVLRARLQTLLWEQ